MYREYIHSNAVSVTRQLLVQESAFITQDTANAGPLYALAALCPHDTPNSLDVASQPDDVLHLLKALHRRIMLKRDYAILFRLLSFYHEESLPADVHELCKQHMSILLVQSTGEKRDLKRLFRYAAMVLEYEITMPSPWATNLPGIIRGLQSMLSQRFLLSAAKNQMQRGFAVLLVAYKERQELFERLFQVTFSVLNVHETTIVLRKLITAIDPTKSYTHPYIGGEKTRPEWWPSGFQHNDIQGLSARGKQS
jgi:sulfur relay (sulfurtransferase) DsrF/TusC family protein